MYNSHSKKNNKINDKWQMPSYKTIIRKENYNKNILADENPPQISKYKAEKG